jgi:hypothetical protein
MRVTESSIVTSVEPSIPLGQDLSVQGQRSQVRTLRRLKWKSAARPVADADEPRDDIRHSEPWRLADPFSARPGKPDARRHLEGAGDVMCAAGGGDEGVLLPRYVQCRRRWAAASRRQQAI